MTKAQLAVGVVLWLTVAWFGFRWITRPFVWSNRPAIAMRTLETARKEFPIHVASFRTDRPIISRTGLFDDEVDPDEEALRDWAFRETRNRFFIGFAFWMASGWFIHWFIGRIVRGQKDYT